MMVRCPRCEGSHMDQWIFGVTIKPNKRPRTNSIIGHLYEPLRTSHAAVKLQCPRKRTYIQLKRNRGETSTSDCVLLHIIAYTCGEVDCVLHRI